MSATGTLTLYVDSGLVGSGELMTQPGMFGLSGDHYVDHEKEVLAYLARG
jgi:hypothetical protein